MGTLDGNADTMMDFTQASRTLGNSRKHNNISDQIHAATNYL